MNILIAATHLRRPNGGVCTHILDLCKEFVKNHKVVLVADGTDYLPQIQQIPGLIYVELPFDAMEANKLTMFKCRRQLAKLCKEHKIDIIHLHGQRLIPVAWMLRMFNRIPFLWTNHIDAIPNHQLMAKMWKIMRFPIISVSRELKLDLINRLNIDERYITVVTNGVDLSALQPLTEDEKAAIREKFGVTPGAYVISEVARLTPVKGQHLILQSVHTLMQKHPQLNLQILLAGTGDNEWFEKNVLNRIPELGVNCRYLGYANPREVYGISDLAVMPTFHEGFLISSLEAFSMHCPVVRSNTPGYTEMLETALIWPLKQPEKLPELIEYAIFNPEKMQQMADRGAEDVARRFTKEITAKNTLAVYKRILGE